MSIKRTCRLSPLAEADLENIWLYTLNHWSLEQADEYLREIMAALESLASTHAIGRECDICEGYWEYKVGAHILYYRQTANTIDVIRILHGRMDVEGHL